MLACVWLLTRVDALVTLEVVLAGKLLLAHVTRVLFVLPVHQHVAAQPGPQHEGLVALWALVALSLAQAVAALVYAQLTPAQEGLVTLSTLVGPLLAVCLEMLLQGGLVGQHLGTHGAPALLAVPLPMPCQVGLGGRLVATLATLEGTLTCVHQHVLHTVTVCTELLAAHGTLKLAFCTALGAQPHTPGSGGHGQCPAHDATLMALHLHALHHQQALLFTPLLLVLLLLLLLPLLLGEASVSTGEGEGGGPGQPGEAGHEAVYECEVAMAAGTHHVSVQGDANHGPAQGEAKQGEQRFTVVHTSVHTHRGARGTTGEAKSTTGTRDGGALGEQG